MVLVIDCCVRGEQSATRRLCERCLDTVSQGKEIKIIRLSEENILPLTAEDIVLRDSLVMNGELDNEMLKYAVEFRDAERIVIAE